jgi:hypothetical protein
VIDGMLLLPTQEAHKPRVLAAGLAGQAAFVLGRAEATELPFPTIFPREPRLETVGEQLVSSLGGGESKRLRAEGPRWVSTRLSQRSAAGCARAESASRYHVGEHDIGGRPGFDVVDPSG